MSDIKNSSLSFMPMSSKQLRIGVFMPTSVQLLDLATVDVLASMSKEYLHLFPLPAHISEIAPSTKITYITSSKLFPAVNLTADLSVRASHTYEDDDVGPGKLDIIVVPGILDGRRVSGPRGLQDEIIQKYPNTHFVGEEYRWIQDGNLWSSGGITNGNDLMAAYAQAQNKYWPNSISKLGAMLVDVGDRPQIYHQSQRKFFIVFAWQVAQGWLFSMVPFGKDRKKPLKE
ncbi:hypothetical protein DER46DRAFT_641375 [Fusarium sp. MPI-SDFR-AT-0072]|nr:hypothetical protein DER46DRAFT_641375 [Fusarium sp. MPI-SDFR-AT-0072]